jgi:hypothetical protein
MNGEQTTDVPAGGAVPDGDAPVGDEFDLDESELDGPDLDESDEADAGEREFDPLTPELEAHLGAFVLIEDVDLAVSRLETLDYLVDMLRDLEDADDVAEWTVQFGDRDFHLVQERSGRLVVTDIFPVSGLLGLIPREVINLVSAELADQSEDDQELWIETLGDLVAESLALVADEEKMVGHLVRAHGLTAEQVSGDHPALVAVHVALHGPDEGAAAAED